MFLKIIILKLLERLIKELKIKKDYYKVYEIYGLEIIKSTIQLETSYILNNLSLKLKKQKMNCVFI